MKVSLCRNYYLIQCTEAYSEPCKTSKMQLSVKIANSGKLLIIFVNGFILDV